MYISYSFPYLIEKSQRFSTPIHIPILDQCGNFPSKWRRVRSIARKTYLFTIPSLAGKGS